MPERSARTEPLFTPRARRSARPSPRTRSFAQRRLAACAITLALGGTRAASARPGCEQAQRSSLPNGIELVLLPDASRSEVALVSSVHAGFRDDPPGYEGLAHFVEHLTYREAPPFASIFDLYAEAGAVGVNATTTADATDYFALLPAAQLERGLWLEARRLALGLDMVSEQAARDERGVVLREQELRYGYAPGFRLLEATYATLFPAPHPYHAFFSSESSLERSTLDAARRFFALHYRPEQLRLVLVGDFDPALALQLIQRYFGQLGQGRAANAAGTSSERACERWSKASPAPSAARLVLRSQLRNERLELYWPIPAGEDPERWRGPFSLLQSSVGDAARQLELASNVDGKLVRLELASFWMLTIDIVPGQALARAEPLLRQTIEALDTTGLDPAELDALSEAAELRQALDDTRLLAKARLLARRSCRPRACAATQSLASLGPGRMQRFDPSRALIVERRFDPRSPEAGTIERRP